MTDHEQKPMSDERLAELRRLERAGVLINGDLLAEVDRLRAVLARVKALPPRVYTADLPGAARSAGYAQALEDVNRAIEGADDE